jgi:hypothetical protein
MNDQLTSENELTGALTPVDRSLFMPAMSIELAVERYNTLVEFVSRVLRRDVDYGVVPGTDKLTLLKPGAEKLTTFFGLSTRFQLIERIEDWMGEDYGGEPFFYYMYRCQLFRGDLLIAESDGSCNSREQKYRYREAQRICPECKQAAIIKGREEYGGGYVCFRKKGGCGAKFLTGDPVIESQQVGRVPNAEIADQVNTIQKMSQKRSLIAVCLLAVNASEFFTQDVEDMMIGTGSSETQPVVSSFEQRTAKADKNAGGNKGSAAVAPAATADAGEEDARMGREILDACHALGKTEEQLLDWLRKKYRAEEIEALTPHDKREVLHLLQSKIAKQATA